MKNSTKKAIVLVILSLCLAIVFGRFLVETVTYVGYTFKLKYIESDAQHGHWTQYGFVTWTDDHIERYEEFKQEKTEFIESSDVATYLYYSGYTFTGKCIRTVAIVLALLALPLSGLIIWINGKFLLKKLFRRYKYSIR